MFEQSFLPNPLQCGINKAVSLLSWEHNKLRSGPLLFPFSVPEMFFYQIYFFTPEMLLSFFLHVFTPSPISVGLSLVFKII
jgi:hypothetical protein